MGFLVYSGVLGGAFIFDDELLIERNELIRSLGNIPQFFSSSIDSGAFINDGNFFRPLQMVIYTIIFSMFQLTSTLPYHLVPIVLHGMNSVLVYALIRNTGIRREASLAGALLFLVHPVQVQAVAYISGLADPLGLFLLLSGILVLFHQRFAHHRPLLRYGGALLLFLLAMLAKESFIIAGPLVFVLAAIYWRDRDDSEFRMRMAAVAATILLSISYLVLKFTVFNFAGTFGLAQEESAYSTNMLVRITTFISSVWDYFVLVIFPRDLYYEKPLNTAYSLESVRGMFGLLAIALTGIAATAAARAGNRKLLTAIAFIVIPMLPYTGIVPLNAYYLEHWLYVPMTGLAILAALVLDRLHAKEWVMILFILLLALLGLRTYVRAAQWGDPAEFYRNELGYTTDSARIWNNLANIYSRTGQHDKAIEAYERAIELRDDYPQTRHNLGNLYAMQGRYQEAFDQFYLSLTKDPNFIYSHDKMQRLFSLTEGEEERARAFERFIARIRAGGNVTLEEINTVLDITPSPEPEQ
ncbi:MAG: Photosystem I assembly protein Ycf3 [candidate division WS6 bacterium OLB20]|uniref:Photosystem I assembly protein Ycf3 n=1 Tax=candidate division WS6 bacterium OLB20 TaxID=1617426 RepID=A0A136LZM4_9BACT|nr:MAG: Photosystem I assembly protein Ycf3 [candidate division WS6 bacterium OLB20]